MATLTDGLGFEELGDAGDTGSKTSQLWITGSITSESIITDSAGRLRSSPLGKEGGIIYGNVVQGGSIVTSAGSEAVVDFGLDYTGSYSIIFTPLILADGAAAPFVSGILELSGCTMIGEASIPYSWIAIGPA